MRLPILLCCLSMGHTMSGLQRTGLRAGRFVCRVYQASKETQESLERGDRMATQ